MLLGWPLLVGVVSVVGEGVCWPLLLGVPLQESADPCCRIGCRGLLIPADEGVTAGIC